MKTVHILGDSTVESGNAPFFGWGGQLAAFLPEGFWVDNHAVSGRSTKSFLEEGRFAPVERTMKPGDLLLVQFGHNDEKPDEARRTDPDTTYPGNLLRFVSAARGKGALPVLITPVARRHFQPDGSLPYTHGAYPDAMRALAAREGVPLIDLKRITREWLLALGPRAAAAYFVQLSPGEHPDHPDGLCDLTHYNLRGARAVAEMVAGEMRRLGLVKAEMG